LALESRMKRPYRHLIWRTRDARGVEVGLVDCASTPAIAAQRLEMSRVEFRRLRREATPRGARGCSGPLVGIACLGVGSWIAWRTVDFLIRWREVGHVVVFGISGVAFVCAGALCFRMRGAAHPTLFTLAMLRRSRCPRCGYRLDRCAPDPADGCTICPECGAAWRLGAATAHAGPEEHA
jgi:hypothetical protein